MPFVGLLHILYHLVLRVPGKVDSVFTLILQRRESVHRSLSNLLNLCAWDWPGRGRSAWGLPTPPPWTFSCRGVPCGPSSGRCRRCGRGDNCRRRRAETAPGLQTPVPSPWPVTYKLEAVQQGALCSWPRAGDGQCLPLLTGQSLLRGSACSLPALSPGHCWILQTPRLINLSGGHYRGAV